MAHHIGLPVPPVAIVNVGEKLLRESPSLRLELPGSSVPLEAGQHFGSRHVMTSLPGEVFDIFPSKWLWRIRNLDAFAGALAFDLWTCNSDNRQAVFSRVSWMSDYFVTLIDQGNCFGGEDWGMSRKSLRGLHGNLEIYSWIHWKLHGRDPFAPWDRRVLQFDPELLRLACNAIPESWYDNERGELANLVDRLLARRGLVWNALRELVERAAELLPKDEVYNLGQLLPLIKQVQVECFAA